MVYDRVNVFSRVASGSFHLALVVNTRLDGVRRTST